MDRNYAGLTNFYYLAPEVWRLLIAQTPPPEAPGQAPRRQRKDSDSDPFDDEYDRRIKDPSFRARCYYLDYDGKVYGAVERTFKIHYYEGEKDIRELDIYPLRFADKAGSILQTAKEAGKLFTEAIPHKHMMCESWTCDTDPVGLPVRLPVRFRRDNSYPPRAQLSAPEYVEGEVIIDLKGVYSVSAMTFCVVVLVPMKRLIDLH